MYVGGFYAEAPHQPWSRAAVSLARPILVSHPTITRGRITWSVGAGACYSSARAWPATHEATLSAIVLYYYDATEFVASVLPTSAILFL
jgi:hypothetical protein